MRSLADRGEPDVIRSVALLLALALAAPALAQTPQAAAPKSSLVKPRPAKRAAKKPPPPKAAAAAERGPCIGVIPHIGESFVEQHVGLTAFGNDLNKVPIASWGLDDLVVARVRAAAGPRFSVRRIAYPANAFEVYDHPSLFQFPQLKPIVQTVAGAGGCERYVAVVEGNDQYGNTNQLVRGVGVVNGLSLTDHNGITYLFALTHLEIFDGRTFEILKQGGGLLHEETTLGGRLVNDLMRTSPLRGPSRKLENFPWPPSPDAVTGLREPTSVLLATSLDTVLPKLLAQ
jgi:hypothetical protein